MVILGVIQGCSAGKRERKPGKGALGGLLLWATGPPGWGVGVGGLERPWQAWHRIPHPGARKPGCLPPPQFSCVTAKGTPGKQCGLPGTSSPPLAGGTATREAGDKHENHPQGTSGGDCRTRRWTLAACALVSTSLIALCRLTDIIHIKNLIQGLSHSKQSVHPNCNDINDVVVVMSEVMLPLTSGPSLPPPWHTLLPSLPAPA